MAQFASAHTAQQQQHGLKSSTSICSILPSSRLITMSPKQGGEVALLLNNSKQSKFKEKFKSLTKSPCLCSESYHGGCIWSKMPAACCCLGVEEGGVGGFSETAPTWSPWSTMTQPGPLQPEHLDQAFSSGDVSTQSGLITPKSLGAIKAAYHVCLFSFLITQRGHMGQFHRIMKSGRERG